MARTSKKETLIQDYLVLAEDWDDIIDAVAEIRGNDDPTRGYEPLERDDLERLSVEEISGSIGELEGRLQTIEDALGWRDETDEAEATEGEEEQ